MEAKIKEYKSKRSKGEDNTCVQVTVALPVQDISLMGPVQVVVEVNTQVFESTTSMSGPWTVHRSVGCGCPTDVHHHLFCFTDVKEKVVLLTPEGGSPQVSDGGDIRELLEGALFRVVSGIPWGQ